MPDWPIEEFLTVSEVAELLKLNQQPIRNWLDALRLTSVRIGRRVRVLRSDLDQLIADSCQPDERSKQSQRVDLAHDFWAGGAYRPLPLLPSGFERATSSPVGDALERDTDEGRAGAGPVFRPTRVET